jgi:flagellar motor switch protein FliN/FliY
MTESNLDDIFGKEGESETLDLGEATEGAGGGGGEEVSLDADLAGMLGGESAGGEEAPAGGEGGLDLNLEGGGEGGFDLNLGEGAEAGAEAGADMGALMGAEEVAPPAAGGAPGAVTADGLALSKQALSTREAVNLDFLLDVKLDVTFEVGRSKMLISDLLTLGQGSVVELHRLVGEDLDLLVNGRLIAKGEVVVVNEKFGCRISEIVSPEERIRHMGGY